MSELALFPHRRINPPADVPIPTMIDDQCLDTVLHCDQRIAFYQARKARALARFAELRPPNRPGAELMDGAPEEVAIELGISPNTAATQILQAETLVRRLPRTLRSLEAGEIDYMRMKAMVDLTAGLTDDQVRAVEEKVLARGRMDNCSRFKACVRREVIKADPEAAAARWQEAKAKRDAQVQQRENGMATLDITLQAHEAQLAFAQIDRLAREVKTPERSLAECRADVFMDLVLGKEFRRAQVNIDVMVPLTTLMGLNQHPGEISGYGPITAEYARELAKHATWLRLLTDDSGRVIESSKRRLASPELRRFLRARDWICRQPGCNSPAERTEVDHTRRHTDGGQTEPDNNHLRCQRHNLMKERSPWQIHQLDHGTLHYTTPTGRVHITHSEPHDLPPF